MSFFKLAHVIYYYLSNGYIQKDYKNYKVYNIIRIYDRVTIIIMIMIIIYYMI